MAQFFEGFIKLNPAGTHFFGASMEGTKVFFVFVNIVCHALSKAIEGFIVEPCFGDLREEEA